MSRKPTEALEREILEKLRDHPDDAALRVRLLELYFESGREEDFLREAKVYRNSLQGNLETTDWKQIRSIGLKLFPGSSVFSDSETAPKRRVGEDNRAKPHFELLAQAYTQLRDDPQFLNDLDRELLFVADRPTPLLHARRLSEHFGGAQIYIKREDLAPSGSLLQIAIAGQALLARRLNKKTLVTGTVYGQRGVLMAQAAARLGMQAVIYMDPKNSAAERANTFRMWLCGADVQNVDVSRLPGGDVRSAAIHHWLREPKENMLVMGLDWGPEPYPTLAREFSAVIGRECRRQTLAQARRSPDVVVARGGNNADAIGLFHPFMAEKSVRLVCVQGEKTLPGPGMAGGDEAADPLSAEQRRLSDAILEGMEYLSVTREHAWLRESGRVEYPAGDSAAAKEAVSLMSRLEGLTPPIETAHALAWACNEARGMQRNQAVVVAVCEHADKDILKIGQSMGVPL